MRMGMQTSVKQVQKQQLSANVIHSIRLLSLNSLELTRHLEEQLIENPLLEMEDEKAEFLKDSEINWVEFIKNTYAYEETTFLPGKEQPEISVHSETLKEVLLEQLHCRPLTEVERFIGEWIIDYVEDSGYLTIDSEEVSSFLQIPQHLVERMIDLLKTFEPVGVGARNLGECLSLQLRAAGHHEESLHKLVQFHLEDLAHRRRKVLLETLNLSEHTLDEYVSIIQTLHPKPGYRYGGTEPVYVIPDLFVEEVEGQIVVKTNAYQQPKLTVSSYYMKILEGNPDESTETFLRSRLETARQLVNALQQREKTMLAIAQIVFEHQRGFLKNGDRGLRPLTMKEVGDWADVHESTVSRVVKNKYVLCTRGVYPLRHFFPPRLERMDGDEEGVSSLQIKEKIKEWIHKEKSTKPYSDQKLTELLQKDGFDVSRRTVAKYREQMGILSSRERKIP